MALLKLGSDMGYDVWVGVQRPWPCLATEPDRKHPSAAEQAASSVRRATNKTIELIDVLWLNGNAVVAAFEIESTTSIYSGVVAGGRSGRDAAEPQHPAVPGRPG